MKKKIFFLLIILFIFYTVAIMFCPAITDVDIKFMKFIQNFVRDIPVSFAVLCDCKLYSGMIALPLIIGNIFFFRKYLLIDNLLFSLSPLITYGLNYILKHIVHRLRPPVELQPVIHPDSFSFVSSHTVITAVLYVLTIYYLNLYCKNKTLKIILIILSVIWILIEGLSRILLGVHYPTDVLGAYFFAVIILLFYTHLINTIGGKI